MLAAAVAVLPLAATAPAAMAQTAPAAATPGIRIDANQLRARDLLDRDVYTSDNVELGEIEDLILDHAQGRVVSAVIEVETRLGFTDKYVAIPLNQLRLTPGERRVTIAMNREQVRGLPGINYRD